MDIEEDLNDKLSKLDFKKVRFRNLLEDFKADFMDLRATPLRESEVLELC